MVPVLCLCLEEGVLSYGLNVPVKSMCWELNPQCNRLKTGPDGVL